MSDVILKHQPDGTLVVSFPLLTDLDLVNASPNGLAALLTKRFADAEQAVADKIDFLRQRAALNARTVNRSASRPDSSLPALTTSPTCKGCGTSVEHAGDLCPNCEHKTHLRAPEATIALANQGEPPYKTRGNFRDLPDDREAAADIQRVSES